MYKDLKNLEDKRSKIEKDIEDTILRITNKIITISVDLYINIL